MTSEDPIHPHRTWRTLRQGFGLVFRGVTFRTAFPVALVVGTVITLVNQGEVLWRGQQTSATVIRIVANYLIPFTVASIGYLAPLRRPKLPITDR